MARIDRMEGRDKLCIFIVDDEATLAEMAGQLLELKGYKPTLFNDPLDLLEQLESGAKPALIITDYLMGAVNGLQVLQEYRRLCPGGRCILLSGTITGDLLSKANQPPDRFLAKPYSAEDLLKAVDDLIGTAAED